MVQQYESCEQMLDAHESQLLVSLVPEEQIECEHVLPPPLPLPPLVPQVSPQIEPTSPTHTESHEVLQQ